MLCHSYNKFYLAHLNEESLSLRPDPSEGICLPLSISMNLVFLLVNFVLYIAKGRAVPSCGSAGNIAIKNISFLFNFDNRKR